MHKNKYDDVDFCINTLYDYLYNKKKTEKCYTLKHINPDNISLADIKKPSSFHFDLIFKEKFVFIGKNNCNLMFKRQSSTSFPATVRIGAYNEDNANYNDMLRSEIVDMKINYLLSELAMLDAHKFILLPIMNFDISKKELEKTQLGQKLMQGKMYYVQLFEHYHNLVSLRTFLKTATLDDKIWKILLFQILYSLYKITFRYPAFRHNKLDLNSIVIYKVKSKPKQLKVGNIMFNIPSVNFECKLTNFTQSNIAGIVPNNDVEEKDAENQYYDVHYIINSLMNFCEKHNIRIFW